jgi:hypothetical protein
LWLTPYKNIGNRVEKDKVFEFFLQFGALSNLVERLNVFDGLSHFLAIVKE